MRRLDHLLKYHDAHIEGYACLFFILSLFKPIFFLILSIYIIFLYKKIRVKLLCFLFIIITLIFLFINVNKIPEEVKGNVSIINIENKTYTNEITIKYKFKKYVFNTKEDLKLNTIIYIDSITEPFLPQIIHHGFNEKQYYNKKGIIAKLNVKNIVVIEERTTFKNLLLKQIEDLKIKPFIKAFIFNSNNELNKDLYNKLNIIFLFKVSGIHLYALVYVILKFVDKYEIKNLSYYIEITIYGCFYYFSNFNYSILRLLLTAILININIRKNYKFTKLDLLQFTFLIIIIINPYSLFDIGLLILYILLNLISLLEPLYKDLSRSVLITLIAQIVSLPFFSYLNLFIVLLMPLLALFVSGPIFLLTVTTLMFPKLDNISYVIFSKFDNLLVLIDKISTPFILPKLSYVLIFLYFLFWLAILLSKNTYNKFMYFIYIILLFYIPLINNKIQTNIYFLSVGQGDSIYLESESKNIMIDTFNGSYNFLVSKGVKELDYLFLTHPDEDHIKEANLIIDNLKVNNVGISYYEKYPNIYKNERRYKALDKINLNPFYIEVLGPYRKYDNTNDNSLVLKITIKNLKILFTGDIEKASESDLIKHMDLKSDVLKIAHHGSNTSSNKDFIKSVSPKYAVISLGYNNKYGFPSAEVLNTLQNNYIKTYRTDLDYTVVLNYSYFSNKWQIKLPFKRKIWYNMILDEVF